MDTQQVLKIVKLYLYGESYFPQAKKELEEIKKISSLEEQCKNADVAYNYHTTYSQLVKGYFKNYNLLGKINIDDVDNYEKTVNELYNIKIKDINRDKPLNRNNGEKEFCELCKQNIIGQCWYPTFNGRRPISMSGNEKRFCSQQCLESWNKNNQQEQINHNNEIINCRKCYREIKKGDTYWYEEGTTEKFCSEQCYEQHRSEYCDKCLKNFLFLQPCGEKWFCANCYEKEVLGKIHYCKYCHTQLAENQYLLGVCNNSNCLQKLDKENHREREQISNTISELEQKPNKTSQEIDELEELRKKLQELEKLAKKPTSTESNNPDKPWLIPSLVVGGGLIIFVLLIAFIRKKKQKINKK